MLTIDERIAVVQDLNLRERFNQVLLESGRSESLTTTELPKMVKALGDNIEKVTTDEIDVYVVTDDQIEAYINGMV